MKRVNVFKRTQDNWYGNYEIANDARVRDLVEVSFIPLSNGEWRCCVWGNDDLGREFDHADEATVWNVFLQVIGMEFVNLQPLKDLNFVPA